MAHKIKEKINKWLVNEEENSLVIKWLSMNF